jgi:Putative peptidoglycan binding domain
MWIWVMAASAHGRVGALVANAKQLGIRTLFIKSSDGTSVWPQFNSSLVATLHANHLYACAWQYVYGQHPILEAEAAAAAVRDGADCLVIDAEVQYQGLYVQAQRYISKLRSLIGPNFPVALAGFPWIDFHPSFPYSVFLGPGGAQYDTPQMYWKDIGTTVRNVYSHTYEYNELYERPIAPLGQLFDSPPSSQILAFRSISRAYRAGGVSWWDWQSATPLGMQQVARRVGPLAGFRAQTTVVRIARGAVGDVVVWAQEHLLSAGDPVTVDGAFGKQTQTAVKRFQRAHGLAASGAIDPYTWRALLAFKAPAIRWTQRAHGQLTAQVAAVRARRGMPETLAVPWSASLRERANELAREQRAQFGSPSTAKRRFL